MKDPFIRTMLGQGLLVVCCIFYLIWWCISYRPGVSVNRAGGINGILLLITAISGLLGVVFSIQGANALPDVSQPKLNGGLLVLAGVVVYFVLLLITQMVFHRPVTTELVLIIGWAVLELTVISSLNSAARLSDGGFLLTVCIIAAAFVISMVLYVLYYRMEEMRAFYAAMVPLITEAISMGILLVVTGISL